MSPTYGTILNVSGPGTGPVAPPPLHGYGRTDAIHRYVAEQLVAADGTLISTFPDLIGSAPYAIPTGVTSALTVQTAGGHRSVGPTGVAVAATNNQRMQRTPDLAVRSVIQVSYLPVLGSTTEDFYESAHRWRTFYNVSTLANGLTFGSASGGAGLLTSAGALAVGAYRISGFTVEPTTGAAILKKRGATEVTATLTLNATKGTLDYLGPNAATARFNRWAEQIEFSAALTAAELETVMTALAAHYV